MTKHQAALERLNLKEGDRVRVVARKCEGYTDGWENDWVPSMTRAIGEIRTVRQPGESYGVFMEDGYWYPATCLERINSLMIDCTIPE